MVSLFESMGFKPPRTDSVDVLKAWMITKDMGKQEFPQGGEEEGIRARTGSRTPVTYHQFPKLPTFCGELNKDTEYDLWRYEVDCLLQTKIHSTDVILQAMRRSLKGEAALIAMKLGPHATVTDILTKLRSAFGTLRRSSNLLSEFYSTTQAQKEDVASWSCRLERLVYQLAKQKSISQQEQDDMLRTRLWDGLKPELKSLAGHKYDIIFNFDELRLCLREMEFDLSHATTTESKSKTSTEPKAKNKSASVNMASSEDSRTDDIADLKRMVRDLASQVGEMKRSAQVFQQYAQPAQPAQSAQPAQTEVQHRQYGHARRNRGRGRFYRSGRGTSSPAMTSAMPEPTQEQGATGYHPPSTDTHQPWRNDVPVPVCWTCGYPGHVSYGCRVRTDHRRRPLNYFSAMGRGTP